MPPDKAPKALAKVESPSPDDFSLEQKSCLRTLFSRATHHLAANGASVSALPETAPFTRGQREHINTLLARFRAGESKIEK